MPNPELSGLTVDPTEEIRVGENCALVAVVFPHVNRQLPGLLVEGLQALQHRGQEASGLALCAGRDLGLELIKGLGLVGQVYTPESLSGLSNYAFGIGHNRYSTSSGGTLKDAQPFTFNGDSDPFALAHNGQVIVKYPLEIGMDEPHSDSYKIAKSIQTEMLKGNTFTTAVTRILSSLNGAFSLVLLSEKGVYVARDPWGLRPLIGAPILKGGYAVASETVALEKMGADLSKYIVIPRGTFCHIHEDGITTIWEDPRLNEVDSASCSFELSYFASHASIGPETQISNHEFRYRLGHKIGQQLYEMLRDFDAVVPIPMSGTSYALGVAQALRVSFDTAITANRYTGRNFISPHSSSSRTEAAKRKFSMIEDHLRGKKIVLVDDSIVKGPTMRSLIITMLRDYGVSQIDLVIGMPPIVDTCSWGIDFADKNQLIYHKLMNDPNRSGTFSERLASWLVGDEQELLSRVRVHFQSTEDFQSKFDGNSNHAHCFHCFTGVVPQGLEVSGRDPSRSGLV